jgi:hypothetical protein
MKQSTFMGLKTGCYYMAYTNMELPSAKNLTKYMYVFKMGQHPDAVAVDLSLKMGWDFSGIDVSRAVKPARPILMLHPTKIEYFEITEDQYLLHVVAEFI